MYFSPQTPFKNRTLLIMVGGAAALFFACAVACAAALLFALQSRKPTLPVTLIVADSARQLSTAAHTVRDLLRDNSVIVTESDHVSPAPDTVLESGMIVNVQRIRAVTLTVDGQSQAVETAFTNPLDILKQVGISPGASDRVMVDGTRATLNDLLVWPVPVSNIAVLRPVSVHIDVDGTASTMKTLSPTVGDALFEAGVTLYLADQVTPDLHAPVTPDMTIRVHHSRPVSIVADGVTLETRTQGKTISDALVSAGLSLVGLDYTIPGEDTPLQPGMLIRVIRVTEQVMTEQESIPFETVYQAEPKMELDQQIVVQEGQKGIRQKHIRVRYENGVEISRQEETNTVAREPVPRSIAYGTNVVLRAIDTPDGPRQYWRRVRLYATSYYPKGLGGSTITASGRTLTKGVVGIDPTLFPYGTQMYIPGYGVGVAGDTGAARRSRLWIDLGYDDSNYEHWSKYVDVYLLAPVPDKIIYILPN
jgi:uncharacterized protein YabE (DUF348 family)/3D (Asp-Asp-Asp) domain-containing protein